MKKLVLLIMLCLPLTLNSAESYNPNSFVEQYNKWDTMVIQRVREEGLSKGQIVDLKERKEWEKTKTEMDKFKKFVDDYYRAQMKDF